MSDVDVASAAVAVVLTVVWLGTIAVVRARLADDEVFATVPPFAVPMWDRYLSYGAALGVAAGAVRPIPMGVESDTRAWSSYGGRWREVRVRYPRVFPLGWGMSTASAMLRALPAAAAAATFLFVVVPAVPDPRDEEGAIAVLAAALVAGPVVVALVAAFVVVQALIDLRPARVVIGQVVRLRTFGSDEDTRHYVAVDDGTATKIRAWRVDAALYEPLEQYEDVTAIVTWRLRHVHSIAPRGV